MIVNLAHEELADSDPAIIPMNRLFTNYSWAIVVKMLRI